MGGEDGIVQTINRSVSVQIIRSVGLVPFGSEKGEVNGVYKTIGVEIAQYRSCISSEERFSYPTIDSGVEVDIPPVVAVCIGSVLSAPEYCA